jgi:hypothetical protein
MFLRWWKNKPRLQKLRYHWKTELLIPIANKGYIIPALSNQSRVDIIFFLAYFVFRTNTFQEHCIFNHSDTMLQVATK